jgi:hypothetical protein
MKVIHDVANMRDGDIGVAVLGIKKEIADD